MVTTTEILPCPALQTFIRCYTLREFDTMGVDFSKPLPANHEFSLAFTLRGSLYTYNTVYKNLTPTSKKHVIGLQTASKGMIIFNGEVRFFSVQFRPDGFYKLFGIPSTQITDNVFDMADIIPGGVEMFYEQLCEARNLSELKKCSDKFFFSHLCDFKTSDPYYSITSTSSFIFRNPGNVNIKNLANEANMSLKRFEIKFT